MIKKILLLFMAALALAGCNGKKPTETGKTPPVRQLVNELELAKRPFIGIFPHASGRLLVLLIDQLKPEFTSATIDLEYLAGNALKGGRSALNLPVEQPHARGFLLGSCSTGGKCSFDTNLINGTLKTRLNLDPATLHVLKSDYIFVNGAVSSADGKVSYQPAKAKQQNQIVADTQGLPKSLEGELAYGPLIITAVSAERIQGELTVKAAGVKKVLLYDGSQYRDLKATLTADSVTVTLNGTPWSKTVTISRDDQKGAAETVTLYALGPIILLK